MSTQILMPALSPTMEEGKLAKWHVKEGDAVKTGDILAEIETDKATMEFEAIDEGRIGRLLVPEGAEGVKVNAPIATLLGEGETAEAGPRRRHPLGDESDPRGDGAGIAGEAASRRAAQPSSAADSRRCRASAAPAPAATAPLPHRQHRLLGREWRTDFRIAARRVAWRRSPA